MKVRRKGTARRRGIELKLKRFGLNSSSSYKMIWDKPLIYPVSQFLFCRIGKTAFPNVLKLLQG